MQRKLTKDLQQQVLTVIGVGGTREMAAQVVGCNRVTIYNTAKADKVFAKKLAQAQNSPEIAYLMTVAEASNKGKQWRAAIWALERMFPERFSKRSPTAFTLEQMREVIDTVVATISRSVPGKVNREMIRRKIDQYANSLARKPRSKRHGKRTSAR
jgi:hypothetical protein